MLFLDGIYTEDGHGKQRFHRVKALTTLVHALSHRIARSLEKQGLQELSRMDGLTGLANRRYFEEILRREWLNAQRNDLGLTVIMLDMAFHYRYGHPAGDQCLREMPRELKQHARRSWSVFSEGTEVSVL